MELSGVQNTQVNDYSESDDDDSEEEDSEVMLISKRTASLPARAFVSPATATAAGKNVTDDAPAGINVETAEQCNKRLQARVFELENRLRETEEELEFYFTFYKKAKRAASATTAGDNTVSSTPHSKRRTDASGEASAKTGEAAATGADSDSESGPEDGAAPINVNYTGEKETERGRARVVVTCCLLMSLGY